MPTKTKKILLFSCEPGGAEVLCPVIRLLKEHAYEVVVLACGYGAERFDRQGIHYRQMRISSADVARLTLQEVNPDYLITSATSFPWIDMSEKYLWEAAKRCGVGSLAFIDQWQNYSVRFSGPGAQDSLRYLPDHINSINETGRREMIEEGFPDDRLVLFGHPYLSAIRESYAAQSADTVIAKFGNAPSIYCLDEMLLFVSEPLLENFGNSKGYSQYDVLEYFLENVKRCRKKARVVIKLHPKDNRGKYQIILEHFSAVEIHIVQNELSSLECLTLSNRIFGMTSIMLVEAFLLGKTVVSLQPGLKGKDPLVLSRYRLIPRFDHFHDFDPFAFDRFQSTSLQVAFDEAGFLNFLADKASIVHHTSLQKGMRLYDS
jgi:hypothetical protein